MFFSSFSPVNVLKFQFHMLVASGKYQRAELKKFGMSYGSTICYLLPLNYASYILTR